MLSEEHCDLLDQLPKLEQQIIDLYLKRKFNQTEVARILHITQGAVSSRLGRIRARLIFLGLLKGIDFNILFDDLKLVIKPLELEIAQNLTMTTCQSETASNLNHKYSLKGNDKLTQVKVRHRFKKVLKQLKNSTKYRRHYDALQLIDKNLYLRHEVKLPHYDRKF